MKIQDLKKFKIPNKSGVYFFKKGKEIIYIGKATSLKDRVKSYFGKDLIGTRGPIVLDMVFQTDKIDWKETDSVLEALILEASLIKKFQPKYNTKEKSDKSFNYICITKEKLPKVIIVRGKNLKEEEKVFGPYTNGSQLREALKIIRRIFPFLDEKSKNNYNFYKQVELVPDISNLEKIKIYLQDIKNIKLLLKGKKKDVIRNIKKDMMQNAKERKFERANELKKQLFALQHINDVALIKNNNEKIESSLVSRIEAYDIAHMGGKNMVGVMTVMEDGRVNKNEYKKFKIKSQNDANDTGALLEVLERRFKHIEWPMPNLIVIDGSTAQINVAGSVLKHYGLSIQVVSVVKDDKHKMKEIKGNSILVKRYKSDILLLNSEAHRFAINYHKNLRSKNFLKKFIK